MQIIAINHRTYEFENAVVSVSQTEMLILLGLTYNDREKANRLQAGEKVEICDRFKHAMSILREVEGAEKMPEILRTFANMLELSKPAMQQIVATPVVAPDEAKA